MEIAFSNVLRLVVHRSMSFSLVPMRSVFFNTLIDGKFRRYLIDVARSVIETKFTGDVIKAPSKRKILVFSSDEIFSTRKGPLVRYANNSI